METVKPEDLKAEARTAQRDGVLGRGCSTSDQLRGLWECYLRLWMTWRFGTFYRLTKLLLLLILLILIFCGVRVM